MTPAVTRESSAGDQVVVFTSPTATASNSWGFHQNGVFEMIRTRVWAQLAPAILLCVSAFGQAGPQQPGNQGQAAAVTVTQGPTVEYADDLFAVVTYMTSTPSESRVYFGTTPNDLNRVSENRTIGTIHRVDLSNLQPATTYYFRIDNGTADTHASHSFRTIARGAAPVRNQSASQVQSAGTTQTASAPPPAAAPVLQPRSGQPVSITKGPSIQYADDTSAVITWTTSAPAATRLFYGDNAETTTQLAQEPGQGTFHRVHIANLRPQTTYYFRVDAGDSSTAVRQSFRTVATGAQPIYDQQPSSPAGTQIARAPAASPSAPAAAPTPAPTPAKRSLIVPGGVEVEAKLKDTLSTRTAHAGDAFTAEVTQPVRANNGAVAIPAGTLINGEVLEAESGKTLPMLRGKGRLSVRFRDLILPNHTSYPLTATLLAVHGKNANSEGEVESSTSGKSTAKDVGIGAGLGTVAGLIFGSALKGLAIGAIAGGGYVLATQGKDVEIPANSEIKLRLDQGITMPAAQGEAVQANPPDR